MEDYAEEVTLLKRLYKAALTHGEGAGRIKFQDISERLRTHFPNKKYSPKMVSDAVTLAFPASLRKRCGEAKLSYCYGITEHADELLSTVRAPPTTCTVRTPEASVGIPMHTDKEKQLLERVNVLEERERQLMEKINELEDVAQLGSWFSPENLLSELDTLTQPHNSVFHGPDTVQHLQTFSIENLISEFTQLAPHLYELLIKLGQGRYQFQATGPSMKAIMALCTLIKGRSSKVLGLQMLITFMLIARATSKQVRFLM